MINAVGSITGNINSKQNIVGAVSIGKGTFGTSNYNELSNKPSINGVTLLGDNSLEQLNIASKDYVETDYQKKAELDEKIFNITYEDGTTETIRSVVYK